MEGANYRIFAPPALQRKSREAALLSALVHVSIFALLAAGLVDWLSKSVEAPAAGAGDMEVRFVVAGGSAGAHEAAESAGAAEDLPAAADLVEPASAAETPPPTPLAPRVPRPLRLEELEVPVLPQETAHALDVGALDSPQLPQIQSQSLGGLGPRRKAPVPGGSGIGPAGASRRGAPHARGSYDVDPVPIYKPTEPPYPEKARERMVSGEVILEVIVKLDGSTEVVSVIKSLPHCVDAAIENARKWRWKPALKDGRPVEAYGIITVSFDLFRAGAEN